MEEWNNQNERAVFERLTRAKRRSNGRIVRAVTAKLEHEFEKEKAAGNARAAGTFVDWLKSLPWTEILKLIAELLKLFS